MFNVLGKEFPVSLGRVINRPSKTIKTPYVADVCLSGFEGEEAHLAHTPSLGCNGMVDSNATVFMMSKAEESKAKCRYTVIASQISEKDHNYIVGVDPTFGEKLGRDILLGGTLQCFTAKTLDSQFSYEDCRFDFKGITTSNEPFICEVKNVSIAVYENIRPSQMKKRDYTTRAVDSKVAIFPSGFKPKGQTHSERAVKQTKRLTDIKRKHPEVRCLILYVIQREDISSFQISNGDQTYLETVKEAFAASVEIAAVSVSWKTTKNNTALVPTIHNNAVKVSMGDNI